MNPYLIPLYGVPALITIAASLSKNKFLRWGLLALAIIIFWGILQFCVIWAYTHPFNSDDGGPRTFALFFGWVFGLIAVIIPTYSISKGIQWLVRRNRK